MTRPKFNFEVRRQYVLNDGRVAKIVKISDTGLHTISKRSGARSRETMKLLVCRIHHSAERLVLLGDGTYAGKPGHPLSIVCELHSGRRRAA